MRCTQWPGCIYEDTHYNQKIFWKNHFKNEHKRELFKIRNLCILQKSSKIRNLWILHKCSKIWNLCCLYKLFKDRKLVHFAKKLKNVKPVYFAKNVQRYETCAFWKKVKKVRHLCILQKKWNLYMCILQKMFKDMKPVHFAQVSYFEHLLRW